MNETPNCPNCDSEFAYHDGVQYACPDCDHEWVSQAADSTKTSDDTGPVYKDANGNILQDGDTVTLIKDLKVKGAQGPLKAGTRVKNIRLVDGDHDIDCKIPGFGAMKLKSLFVKKG